MNIEVPLDPEIEKICSELVVAVGKFPFTPKEVPQEFRKKILTYLAGGGSSRKLSAAIGINSSNFYLWKSESKPSKLQEIKVIPDPKALTPIIIAFSDAKRHFSIEGLKFEDIRLLLKERLL